MTRSHLATRRIPVADTAPVQLTLGLRWQHPIDRPVIVRDPKPTIALAVARVRKAAA